MKTCDISTYSRGLLSALLIASVAFLWSGCVVSTEDVDDGDTGVIPGQTSGGSGTADDDAGMMDDAGMDEGDGSSTTTGGDGTTTGGDSGGGSTGGSAQTCDEILTCLNSCGQNDNQCQQNCLNNASQSARDDYNALAQCARGNCPQGQTSCIQNNCSSEAQACGLTGGGSSGGSSGGTTGTTGGSSGGITSCGELNRCLGYCGQNDQSCQSSIQRNASQQAVGDFNQLAQCFQNNCQNAQDQQTCLQQNCSSSYQACFGAPSGSNYSCGELLRCVSDCSQGDQQCQSQCQNNASQTAVQEASAYSTCIQNNCQNAQDTGSCIQTNCKAEETTCYNCPSGI